MSRSRRKTPIVGNTTAKSEKWDKRKANRRLRHSAKIEISQNGETDITIRDVSNVWSFHKDGKHYWPEEKAYRK